MTRFLHVSNGTSTTGTIQYAGIPGAVSLWADPLHDGPVPGGISDGELLAVRARHLGAPEPVDPVIDLREWRRNLERHDTYDEAVLWFEHDLFDQLNLIQLLSWIHEHVPATKTVSLICIGSFPGHPQFKGLGELSAPELASLLPTRKPVTEAQYELALRAWHAFREPTPDMLDEVRRGDTTALPFLAPALTRFLEEYPWTGDGLSRTERRLLTLADRSPITLIEAFPRMDDGDHAHCTTDTVLNDCAVALSSTTPPLLTRSGGSDLRGLVSLTADGRDVLAGKKDRVALCGFDRWFGGVHVQADKNLWRWDDRRQEVVRE